MQILETMVSNTPGGRATVTFLGEGSEAVEVHMAAEDGASESTLIEKAKVMLLHAAAANDSGRDSVADIGPNQDAGVEEDLSVAPMSRAERDPFAAAPGEDDDNAYQSPDDALPGDRDEASLDRLMRETGTTAERRS